MHSARSIGRSQARSPTKCFMPKHAKPCQAVPTASALIAPGAQAMRSHGGLSRGIRRSPGCGAATGHTCGTALRSAEVVWEMQPPGPWAKREMRGQGGATCSRCNNGRRRSQKNALPHVYTHNNVYTHDVCLAQSEFQRDFRNQEHIRDLKEEGNTFGTGISARF